MELRQGNLSKQSQLGAYALNDWLCHYVQSKLITVWSRGDPARTCLLQGMEGHGLILNQGCASVRSKCEEGTLPLQISESQPGDFLARNIPARRAATAPYCPPDPEPRPLLISALPEERALPAAKGPGGQGLAPVQRDAHTRAASNPSVPPTPREKRGRRRSCTSNTLLPALISLLASPARHSPTSLPLGSVSGPQRCTPVAMVMRVRADALEAAVTLGCWSSSRLREARGERCRARLFSTLAEAVSPPKSRGNSLQPTPKDCSHRPAKGAGVPDSLGSLNSKGGRGRSPSTLVLVFRPQCG